MGQTRYQKKARWATNVGLCLVADSTLCVLSTDGLMFLDDFLTGDLL